VGVDRIFTVFESSTSLPEPMVDTYCVNTVSEAVCAINEVMLTHYREVARKLHDEPLVDGALPPTSNELSPGDGTTQSSTTGTVTDPSVDDDSIPGGYLQHDTPTNTIDTNPADNVQIPDSTGQDHVASNKQGYGPAWGTLTFNLATFDRYVTDLKARSTLLLSEKDERWSNAGQCARKSDDTSSEQKLFIERLLRSHASAFHKPGDKLSATWVTEHGIPLVDESRSVFIRTRAIGHTETGIVLDLTHRQVHAGVVEPCPAPSSFNSPHIPVPKKQKGKYRLIGQFVQLNKATTHIPMFPMARIDDSLHLCKGMKIFSTSDFQDGYFQIPIKPSDRHKTAYRIHNHGQYQYIRMAQGLAGAPATFNFAVNQVLGWTRLLHVNNTLMSVCVFFVDDVMIASKTFDAHLVHWGIVLEALERAKLVLNMAKTDMFKASVTFCGRSIDCLGIGPTSEDLARLREWPMPRTTKALNSFCGFVNYLNAFIPRCAILCQTMRKAPTSGHFITINSDYVAAYEAIRGSITDDMRLALPIWDDMNYPFILETDASKDGCAAVLLQKSPSSPDTPQVISFTSKPFIKLEDTSLPIPAKEAYAIAFALGHFRRWLLGQPLIIRTDHRSLQHTFTRADANNQRFVRWLLIIQEFAPLTVKHIVGTNNSFADALSRNPTFNEQYLRLSSVEKEFADRVYLVNDAFPIESVTFEPLQTTVKLPELLTNSIRSSQLKDEALLPIIQLLEGTVPSKDQELLKQAQSFEMIDAKLFKRYLPLPKLAVPANLRESIITMYHDDVLAGHRGAAYTQARIEMQFWWPKLSEDVLKYVQACPTCCTNKVGRRVHVPSGSLSKGVPYPFHTINMDVLGPFSTTIHTKNRFIISFVCVLSRWAEAYATTDHTATTVADCLISLITRHGFPKVIVSDRGSEFGAHVFNDMMKKLGVDLRPHEPYAHWRSGSVERFHGTLLSILRCYTDRYPNRWDTHLPLALFAYRTCTQQRLGCSPFKLLYGREPTSLLQSVLDLPDSPYPEVRPIVSWLHQAISLSNHLNSPGTSKTRDNRPVDAIVVGDLVYKFAPKSDSKLAPRLLGKDKPYLVLDRKNTTITYEDHNGKRATGHVSNFRLAKLPTLGTEQAEFIPKRPNTDTNHVGEARTTHSSHLALDEPSVPTTFITVGKSNMSSTKGVISSVGELPALTTIAIKPVTSANSVDVPTYLKEADSAAIPSTAVTSDTGAFSLGEDSRRLSSAVNSSTNAFSLGEDRQCLSSKTDSQISSTYLLKPRTLPVRKSSHKTFS
jgi:hypothetical protein